MCIRDSIEAIKELEAKVKKLILTHFVPPSFDEEKLKNEVRGVYKGDIIIGQDLLNIDV